MVKLRPVTTSEATPAGRERRARVSLPREIVERFRANTDVTPGSTLVYHWIVTAARHALDGEIDLVPPRSSAPPPKGEQLSVDFPMSKAESAACIAALRDVGSSVRAVVAACMDAYDASGGDALRMTWPRRERRLAA